MGVENLFDRYDFLTTVVPGAAFLFALVILFLPAVDLQFTLTAELLLILVVAVFLIGEVVTMFTDTADPGQRLFAFMLLAAEVRLELDELEASIRQRIAELLGTDASDRDEFRTTVRKLVQEPWESVADRETGEQHCWAWAHVASLMSSRSRNPWSNPLLALVMRRREVVETDDWWPLLRMARYEASSDPQSDPRYSNVDSVSWSRRQLSQWIVAGTDFAEPSESPSPAVTSWFEDGLWGDLLYWADLTELGVLADGVQSGWGTVEQEPRAFGSMLQTYYLFNIARLIDRIPRLIERIERAISSLLPGPAWVSNRFYHTDPVPWTEEQTVRRLRRQFRLPSLRDQYALLNAGQNWSTSYIDPFGPDPWKRSVLSDLYKRYTDVFRTLYTVVEDELGAQSERFRSRSVFHHNMWVTVGIVLVLYVGAALLRILDRVLSSLDEALGGLLAVLQFLDGLLAGFVSVPDSLVGTVLGVDWLILFGAVVLVALVLLREYDVRSYRFDPSIARSVLTVALLSGVLVVGFLELRVLFRSLAFLWIVALGFLALWTAFSLFVTYEFERSVAQRAGLVLAVSASVLLLLAVFVQFPLVENTLITTTSAVSEVSDLVLTPGWLIFSTLLAGLLWLMFSVWTRKYEHEYLRYLLATYYTTYTTVVDAEAVTTDADPDTDAERSPAFGTDTSV